MIFFFYHPKMPEQIHETVFYISSNYVEKNTRKLPKNSTK